MKQTAAAAAALGIALAGLTAAPAHADSQSYLDYLRSHGAVVVPWYTGEMTGHGFTACNALHSGESPDQAAGIFPLFGPEIVEAAQHELCPDTLH